MFGNLKNSNTKEKQYQTIIKNDNFLKLKKNRKIKKKILNNSQFLNNHIKEQSETERKLKKRENSSKNTAEPKIKTNFKKMEENFKNKSTSLDKRKTHLDKFLSNKIVIKKNPIITFKQTFSLKKIDKNNSNKKYLTIMNCGSEIQLLFK